MNQEDWAWYRETKGKHASSDQRGSRTGIRSATAKQRRSTAAASLSLSVAQTPSTTATAMARISRRMQTLALLALFAAPMVTAQLTDLPNLSTATQTTDDSTSETSSAESTNTSDAPSSTDATTTAESTAESTATSSFATTGGTATGSGAIHISNLPTIAGAGIPTMIVPNTADAPFMQKSTLPEGTVFIVVGAVLAFLGACVLFWRGLVAWSINRSVKKAAIASIRGSEKASTAWGGSSTGYNPVKGGLYKDAGSNMSLDALNSAGKQIKSPLKGHDTGRGSPPAGLFFSPTAQARESTGPRPLSDVMNNRSSTYLPAGYYASPNSQAAGGAAATTIGGNLAPYAQRHSTLGPSPPSSPGNTPGTRSSGGWRATSRDGLRAPGSRDGMGNSARNSYLHNRPSNDGLAGSRAPSAYLEDLFENHGNGPRERF